MSAEIPSLKTEDNAESEDYIVPKMLSSGGRIGRLRYLAYSMGVYFLGLLIIGAFTAVFSRNPSMSILTEIVYVVVFVGMILHLFSLVKRRLNDINLSGWFMLLIFVPIANALLLFALLFWPGTTGVNRYGLMPAKNSAFVAIVGFLVFMNLLAAMAE